MSALAFRDRNISRIFLVDDDPAIRGGYEDAIESLGVQTQDVELVSSLGSLLDMAGVNDGFVCDFHLNHSTYSPVNGDVIVSNLYERKIPAILCSRDAEAAHSVRGVRQSIPCILTARDFSPESVMRGFSECIKEFSGEFSKGRRPWEALIRFESLISVSGDGARVLLAIPGWDSDTIFEVDVFKRDIPFFDKLVGVLKAGDIFRCMSRVNLGADEMKDIYIKDWMEL